MQARDGVAQVLHAEAAAGRHGAVGELARHGAEIEVAHAGGAEAGKGVGEFRLDELRALGGDAAEHRPGARIGQQRRAHRGEVRGQRAGDLGAEAGQGLGGGHQLLEGPPSGPGLQRVEAAGHQRHRRRAVGAGAGVAGGLGGEGDGVGGAPARVEGQAGAATAEAGAGRQGDGHHQRRRRGGIGGRAAARKDVARHQHRARVVRRRAAEEAADVARVAGLRPAGQAQALADPVDG